MGWDDLDFLNEAAKKRNAHHLPNTQTKPKEKKRSKYGNKITEYDGIKYHSKLEAQRAQQLDMMAANGEIRYWVRQPQFVLGNGVTYKADFGVMYANGNFEIEDIKGKETPEFIRTVKLLAKRFPKFLLLIMKKGDF